MALGRMWRERAARPFGGARIAALPALGRLAGRATACAVAALLVLTAGMLGAVPSAGASLPSEQARAQQLAQQIVAEGAAVQRAVVQQNAAQARLTSLDAQLAATGAQLLRDRRANARAAQTLRRLVVQAYMTGIGSASLPVLFDAGNDAALLAREYSGVAAGGLQEAISAFRAAEQRTETAAAALRSERAQASAALVRLTAARQNAQASLAQDVVLLEQAKGDIAALQAAAAEQARQASAQEAALAQEEAAHAAQQKPPAQPAVQAAPQPTPQPSVQPAVQAAPQPTPQPAVQTQTIPTAAVQPGPGGYVNPLRAIAGLSPERIDQGVDYSGYGPIYPIGDGVVLNTVNTGWPGGTFITYRLTDGPAAGLVVYVAEDIQPSVQVGEQVSPTTVLGTMYEGPDGIETGWADSTGNGATMAYVAGQFTGANATAYGANFSQLLAALGAPPGVPNGTPAGSLPSNWPTW
ncbi:MAG: coiled-coil domain-containing protein [Acidimicrobiales bacterium]